jgi:hypothetical protein
MDILNVHTLKLQFPAYSEESMYVPTLYFCFILFNGFVWIYKTKQYSNITVWYFYNASGDQ